MFKAILSSDECQSAVEAKVELGDGWRWVASCVTGNGRNESVINICMVSGGIGGTRVVAHHSILKYGGNISPHSFAKLITDECLSESYPNMIITIDADGVGALVIEIVKSIIEKSPIEAIVQAIQWGFPCETDNQKRRFINKRAMASIYTKEAIVSGRMSIDKNPSTVEQGANILAATGWSGRWSMMSKVTMLDEHNIPPADVFDTYCFMQLVEGLYGLYGDN